MTPNECAKEIRRLEEVKQKADYDIREIARAHIPDYHFLNHKVSTFWKCTSSPIGMCVFNISDDGFMTLCVFCNNPPERK